MSFLTSKPVICVTVFLTTVSICLQLVILLNGSDFQGLLFKIIFKSASAYARFSNAYQSPTSIGNHIEFSHDLCFDAMNNTVSCQLVGASAFFGIALPNWTDILHNSPDTLIDKLKNEEPKVLPFGTYNEYFDIYGIKALLIHSSPKLTRKKLFANGLILHLHGGAFIIGSHKSDEPFMTYLHLFSGIPVIAIDYRLAPQFPVQSGALLEDGHKVVKEYLHDHLGVAYNKIYLTGISAGGGAALMIMHEFAKQNIFFGGVVPISPWSNLKCLCAKSYADNEEYDVILSYDAITIMRIYALGCRDVNGGLVEDDVDKCVAYGVEQLLEKEMNPMSADWIWGKKSNTKLLFVASRYEILRDDAVEAHEKAIANGMDSELILLDNSVHGLSLMPHVPEALRSIAQISHALHKWNHD